MNNKVKFLRGTSGEYTVAEKDNDTIYFTTDDGKLYIGDKEVSSGGSYELPIATTEILGGVMPDGTTITVDENGVISGSSNSFGTVGSDVRPVYFYNGVPIACDYRMYKIYKGYLSITSGGSTGHSVIHNEFSSTPAVFLQIYIPNGTSYSPEYGAYIIENDASHFKVYYNLPANATIYYVAIGDKY